MAENVFEAVKQSVSTRDAAAFYGIEVKRNGMACCPFHDDKNPSMKLNEEYFYCFGCGATGDVIDFTAKLFDLSPKEAAEKLAQDFESGDNLISVSGSVGISIYPHDGANFDELYSNSKIALFSIKHKGKNSWLFYNQELSDDEEE